MSEQQIIDDRSAPVRLIEEHLNAMELHQQLVVHFDSDLGLWIATVWNLRYHEAAAYGYGALPVGAVLDLHPPREMNRALDALPEREWVTDDLPAELSAAADESGLS